MGPMKFLLLMYNDEAAWERLAKSEQDTAVQNLMAFTEELAAHGKLVLSHGLGMSREAVSVKLRADGGRAVTDGPYAETKEHVGGYYVIECTSKTEAIEWTKKVPLASWGVEVRQIQIEQ